MKGDKRLEHDIRMGAITVDYMRLAMLMDDIERTKICVAPKTRIPEKFAEAQKLAEELLCVLATERDISLSEGRGHAKRVAELKEFIDMERPVLPHLAGPSAMIEEKDIQHRKINGVDWGSYVDDPKAEDGRAMKLIKRSSNHGVRYNLRDIEFEDGAKYRIRARVRVDKAGDGDAFHTGILETPSLPGTVITNIVRRTDEVSGEYEWYDVATYDPAEHPFASFYISSGDYPRGGKSAANGVYLDKISIERK